MGGSVVPWLAAKLDSAIAESARDGCAAMCRCGIGSMDDAVTFVAKGGALRFAVGGSGGVVAILAEGEGGDGGGEVDALVGGGARRGVLGCVAVGTDDGAMCDAEDDGGRRRTAVAYGAHAYQTGH